MAAVPWLVAVACAVVFLFLPSCTPAQLEAFRAIPITIGIEGEHGTYGYSSKGGLSVNVKAPRVREEKSGITGMLTFTWPPVERRPRRMTFEKIEPQSRHHRGGLAEWWARQDATDAK